MAPKPLRGPQASERTNSGGRCEHRIADSAGVRRAYPGAGETPGGVGGRLLALGTAFQPPGARGGAAEAIWRGREERPRPPRPCSRFPPQGTPRTPHAGNKLKALSRDPKRQKPHLGGLILASIPRESHEDTWSWGPAAPGPPRRVPAQATVTTRHATHLLAGAGFALGRSPEERGPGGEEEVLGVLLQAAVAAAHAAGPVARRPPTRGAGGQAAGAAPARPVRLPARGPEPPAGCPPAAAAAAQSRRPGPSRCLPASPPACRRRLGGERPATPPPGPRPSSRGPRPARPGRLPTRSWQSPRGGRWGQRSPSASGAPLFPSRVWGTRLDSGAAVLRVAFPTARKLPIPRRSVHPPPPRLTRLWGRAQAEPGTCSTLPPARPLAGSSGWRWRL